MHSDVSALKYHRRLLNDALKCVYIIDNGTSVKIGRAADPEKRISSIETQSGMRMARKWVSPPMFHADITEVHLHDIFRDERLVGEYFKIDFNLAVDTAIGVMRANGCTGSDQYIIPYIALCSNLPRYLSNTEIFKKIQFAAHTTYLLGDSEDHFLKNAQAIILQYADTNNPHIAP